MQLLVQWTLADPTDWLSIDLKTSGPLKRAWQNLATKPAPVGGEMIDDAPGWVMALSVQGINFGGFDHYAVEPFVDAANAVALRLYGWNDDLADWPVGTRNGRILEVYAPAPDARFGGAVNTRQVLSVFTEAQADVDRWTGVEASGGPVVVRPWSEFVVPATAVARHGIWVPQALFDAHVARRSLHSWREWVV